MAQQACNELGAVVEAELAQDIGDVGVDGLERDAELSGRPTGIEPLEQQPRHPELHVCEPGLPLIGALGRGRGVHPAQECRLVGRFDHAADVVARQAVVVGRVIRLRDDQRACALDAVHGVELSEGPGEGVVEDDLGNASRGRVGRREAGACQHLIDQAPERFMSQLEPHANLLPGHALPPPHDSRSGSLIVDRGGLRVGCRRGAHNRRAETPVEAWRTWERPFGFRPGRTGEEPGYPTYLLRACSRKRLERERASRAGLSSAAAAGIGKVAKPVS